MAGGTLAWTGAYDASFARFAWRDAAGRPHRRRRAQRRPPGRPRPRVGHLPRDRLVVGCRARPARRRPHQRGPGRAHRGPRVAHRQRRRRRTHRQAGPARAPGRPRHPGRDALRGLDSTASFHSQAGPLETRAGAAAAIGDENLGSSRRSTPRPCRRSNPSARSASPRRRRAGSAAGRRRRGVDPAAWCGVSVPLPPRRRRARRRPAARRPRPSRSPSASTSTTSWRRRWHSASAARRRSPAVARTPARRPSRPDSIARLADPDGLVEMDEREHAAGFAAVDPGEPASSTGCSPAGRDPAPPAPAAGERGRTGAAVDGVRHRHAGGQPPAGESARRPARAAVVRPRAVAHALAARADGDGAGSGFDAGSDDRRVDQRPDGGLAPHRPGRAVGGAAGTTALRADRPAARRGGRGPRPAPRRRRAGRPRRTPRLPPRFAGGQWLLRPRVGCRPPAHPRQRCGAGRGAPAGAGGVAAVAAPVRLAGDLRRAVVERSRRQGVGHPPRGSRAGAALRRRRRLPRQGLAGRDPGPRRRRPGRRSHPGAAAAPLAARGRRARSRRAHRLGPAMDPDVGRVVGRPSPPADDLAGWALGPVDVEPGPRDGHRSGRRSRAGTGAASRPRPAPRSPARSPTGWRRRTPATACPRGEADDATAARHRRARGGRRRARPARLLARRCAHRPARPTADGAASEGRRRGRRGPCAHRSARAAQRRLGRRCRRSASSTRSDGSLDLDAVVATQVPVRASMRRAPPGCWRTHRGSAHRPAA